MKMFSLQSIDKTKGRIYFRTISIANISVQIIAKFAFDSGIVSNQKHSIVYLDFYEEQFNKIVTFLLENNWMGVGLSILAGESNSKDILDMITGLISTISIDYSELDLEHLLEWDKFKDERYFSDKSMYVYVKIDEIGYPIVEVMNKKGMTFSWKDFSIKTTPYEIKQFLEM